jgi:flagellar basal body-associated protein FliL
LLNKEREKLELDRTSEEIQKSEKRSRLAMIVVLFIVSFAAAMIFISLISAL